MNKKELLYENYDTLIKKCVPGYQKIFRLMANGLNECTSDILDIGIGTGNLEKFIFEKFPQAKITGIDTSKKFIGIAASKYQNKKLKIINSDIKNYLLIKNKFSAIVSSLTIHHFEDAEKIGLFKKIYRSLKSDGVFINFDMIKPETKKDFLQARRNLFQNWKANGLSEDFIEKEKKEMEERDRLVELSKQKRWLKEIGFTFKIIYKSELFCVYKCTKKTRGH
ncbi:MAG: class I SAM-dependent methyltransferase [Candidatus Moranbacteria bacterium]|jgi:tRNA (cmo5U34)-methyltransferase|nr:class I SAM-dependent methyltransferase [Candidatus Moranbacteria bacterium]